MKNEKKSSRNGVKLLLAGYLAVLTVWARCECKKCWFCDFEISFMYKKIWYDETQRFEHEVDSVCMCVCQNSHWKLMRSQNYIFRKSICVTIVSNILIRTSSLRNHFVPFHLCLEIWKLDLVRLDIINLVFSVQSCR